MKLAALLGYDGPVKVWIDGQEAYCDLNGANPAIADSARMDFEAKKGEHEVLVALDSNLGLAWGIFLRFERTGLSQRELARGLQPDYLPEVIGEQIVDAAARVSSMAARNISGQGKKGE